MLQLNFPSMELFDEVKQEFIYIKQQDLQLEHSLVSISKWEAKWHKPFFSNSEKTLDEIQDYVRCMTITQNVNPNIYLRMSREMYEKIKNYLDEPMTATWFSKDQRVRSNREIITAEIIYYWMITYNIPLDFQKWHINRLLTLIRVCSIKNSDPKKMSKKEVLSRQKALNAARRKKLNTSG